MNGSVVHYSLDSVNDLIHFPSGEVVRLDWVEDFELIRQFYRHWGGEDIDAPGEKETEIGQPLALVRDGEILSFMSYFHFREGEEEIGAVATLPEWRNQGLCRRVISEAARQTLERGKTATLTTREDNLAMQAAAEAIGMRRADVPGRK